jgi:flavin reductase (DIM6/NTAB) family NADH-FMN oxidoreductase RutF
MSMKETLDLSQAKWLLESGVVVLVTSGASGHSNIMTCSWQTPIASDGTCLVLLSIGTSHYTRELIRETPELVINVPNVDLIDAVQRAGSVSGRAVDKFRENHLTPVPATIVKPAAIAECIAHLECRVRQSIPMGEQDLLVCEVVHAEAETEAFGGAWIPERARTLHHLGGGTYGVLERSERASPRKA